MDRLTFLDADLGDRTLHGRRDFHDGFVRLCFENGLVLGDDVAYSNQNVHNIGGLHVLTKVG